jgi:hypothetical protein
VRVPPSKQIYTIKFEWRYGISDSHFSKIPTWPQPDFNGHDWPLANGPLFNPDLADLPLSECPDFTPGLVGQRRKRANEILRCLTKLKVCPLRIERILFKWNKANTFPLHDNTITHILLDYYNNLSKNEKENV